MPGTIGSESPATAPSRREGGGFDSQDTQEAPKRGFSGPLANFSARMGKSAGNVYGELVCGTIGPKFSTTAPLPKQGGGSTFRTPMGHQRTLFRVPRPNRDPKNEDLAGHGSVRLVFGTPVCRTARSAPLGGAPVFGVCGRHFLECVAGTFWSGRQH